MLLLVFQSYNTFFKDIGHKYGPESIEYKEKVDQFWNKYFRHYLNAENKLKLLEMDQTFGRLISGLRETDLLESTNIVVVSDHGMTQLHQNIFLGDFFDLGLIDLDKSVFGATSNIHPKNDQEVYN